MEQRKATHTDAAMPNIKTLQKKLAEKEAELRKLRLIEAQYNDILQNMNEAVERDAADYTTIYVNKALCDFYGVTEEEVLFTDSMNWIIPEDRERVDRQMKQITPENPDYRYTCRVKSTRGEMFWIEVFGHCFFDQDGNVLEYQDISRDVTEYKSAARQAERFRINMEEKVRERTLELTEANNKLSKTNSYLQTTLNNINEGVIVIDASGEAVFLNYGSNTTWNANEAHIRKDIRRAVLTDKTSLLYHLMHHKENFHNRELSISSPNGDIPLLASGVCIKDDYGATQGILVLRPLEEIRHLVNKFSGAQARFHFTDIIGNSPIMRDIVNFAQRIAPSEGTVFIEGESGTGKELFAQSIHNGSSRKKGPFIAVNCGAIPRDLIASELFGYADGAFTGAKKGGKPGKFEMASGGTLFLDEIGDMPLEQQISLLRVIQERSVIRVGGGKIIPVDVRIICATNKDLLQEVAKENFRQDLYYRLNVINLRIPPLRERREDIPSLFEGFLRRLYRSEALPQKIMDDAFLDALMNYAWPGNIRELQNITERTFFIANDLPFQASDLPEYIAKDNTKTKRSVLAAQRQSQISTEEDRPMKAEEKEQNEQETILRLLRENHHNASAVAKSMGISRTTLYRKIHKYRLEIR